MAERQHKHWAWVTEANERKLMETNGRRVGTERHIHNLVSWSPIMNNYTNTAWLPSDPSLVT